MMESILGLLNRLQIRALASPSIHQKHVFVVILSGLFCSTSFCRGYEVPVRSLLWKDYHISIHCIYPFIWVPYTVQCTCVCVASSTRTKCYYKFRQIRYCCELNSIEDTIQSPLNIQRFGVYLINYTGIRRKCSCGKLSSQLLSTL
jgi:hypothetical protein